MYQYIKRLSRFDSPSVNEWVIYFIGFIIIQLPAIFNFYHNDGAQNAYTLFAQSLLHGNLTLPSMNSYADMISFNNSYYLPYPPLPSVILLPFVAIMGASNVNTVAIATLMACISLYLIFKILLKLQIKQTYFPWVIAAVFFGTGYWYALFISHHVYAFAHITSFLFQLLIINEVLGKRRWWLVGVYIGCSFLTRQFTLFYFFFALGYMIYLHQIGMEKLESKKFVSLLASVAFFIGIYLAYNYARFGNPFDTGYRHILFIGILQERVSEYGVFNIKYFLFNFYSFLIKGFNIQFTGNDYLSIKDMDPWGTSLLSASPFLIASVKANWPRVLKLTTWITILLILAGQLLYHNNGFNQVNTYRFCLDFLPLLLLLMARGIKYIPEWLFKGMVVYAVLLNIISFSIHSVYQ